MHFSYPCTVEGNFVQYEKCYVGCRSGEHLEEFKEKFSNPLDYI